MAITPLFSSVRARRRRSYIRPTRLVAVRRPVIAEARHRGITPREGRSALYRWSGTATLYTLLALIYLAAGFAIFGAFLALFSEEGRAVLGAIFVVGTASVLLWKSYQRAGGQA